MNKKKIVNNDREYKVIYRDNGGSLEMQNNEGAMNKLEGVIKPANMSRKLEVE